MHPVQVGRPGHLDRHGGNDERVLRLLLLGSGDRPGHARAAYPNNYFFNDHPNAGARSFDYVYSLIGVVTGAFYACMLVCLVPMQLKALCSGGDPSGGIQAEI